MKNKYLEFIGAGKWSGSRQIGFHTHEGTELILVTKGVCQIDVDNLNLEGANGTLFILPGKIPHNQVNEGDVGTSYVSFKNPGILKNNPRTLLSDNWISQWISDICILAEKTNIDINEMASGLLLAITNRINQLEKIHQNQLKLHPALIRAIHFIENNLEQNLSLEDIAHISGVSKSFLSGIFKQQMQISPINYAISLKMKLAKRMLAYSYLSIKEISVKCGFQDPNFFSRTFKKFFHVTPGQYRESNYEHL